MQKTMSSSSQAGVLGAILLLVIGVIILIMVYAIKSGQNYGLANTAGNNIANNSGQQGSVVADIGVGYYDAMYPQVVWTEAHANKRYKEAVVKDISSKCNESNGNPAIVMHNPKTGRDAFVCFIEGYWVVTVKNFDPAKVAEFGDDVVTAFDRADDMTLQEVIDYLVRGGYIVQ